MAKLLKPMVVLLLVLSAAALVLGIMLFSEREIIKARTQQLESGLATIAGSLRYTDPDGNPLNRDALMDVDRMEGELNRLDVHAALTLQELRDAEQDLEVARQERDEAVEARAALETEVKQVRAEIEPLERNIEERTAELARANEQISGFEREKNQLNDRIEDLERQVARIEEENLNLAETISEQRSLIEDYERELFEEDVEIGTPEGLTGEILLVMSDWNFVILNVGRDKGLSRNTEMLVHRDDQLVGRVRVSSVEKELAVAEIMDDWLVAPLEEGDHVLF